VSDDQGSAEGDRLAREFQNGSAVAYGALVDLYQERFYRVAYRIVGHSDDALDVVQDAFVKLHRTIGSWDERSAFYSWAYRIVTNIAIDVLRKRGRDRKAREEVLNEKPGFHEDEEAPDLDQNDLRALISKARVAIESLPPKQKAIVALRHYEGLSLKEIADVRGCAVGTVKSTLHQAFANLRKALGDDPLALAAAERAGREPGRSS
jgi:RNA polymerase sigma-70 factor (ECF subfamily)